MASRGLLLRISFNFEEINKIKITVKKRIELDKMKLITIEIKKVWEWIGVNIRVA